MQSHKGATNEIAGRRGWQVRLGLRGRGPDLVEPGLRLLKAKFQVTFADGRQRIVGIEPPNIGSFDRETDSMDVHDWMTKRGFILASRTEAAFDADVLEVA